MTVDHLRMIRRREMEFYPPPVLKFGEENRKRIVVYLGWRRDMASWMLDTARIYQIQQATVGAAQSILDRLASIDCDVTEDFELYQLSSFVCLLMACKMFESKRTFKRSKIQDLLREYFSQEELGLMELHILYSLNWHVQPPTTIEIAHELLDLVPPGILPDHSRIEEVVSTRLMVALVDSRFMPFASSAIALASVLRTLESILNEQPFLVIKEYFQQALGYEDEAFDDELDQLRSMMLVAQPELEIDLMDTSDRFIIPRIRRPTAAVADKGGLDVEETPEASPRSVVSRK